MRCLLLLTLMLLPIAGIASSYGGAEGRNGLNQRIYIAADTSFDLYVITDNADDGNEIWSEPYDMSLECPGFSEATASLEYDGNDEREFSCLAGHDFPPIRGNIQGKAF